jgi:glycosyltransferase involved in cell wall biosynthesis
MIITDELRRHCQPFSKLYGSKRPEKMDSPDTVLLIDNKSLSHYTSYLALGLSKYRDIVLYGFSKGDYLISGASEQKRIKYFSIVDKIPKGTSVLKMIMQTLFLFGILYEALNKTTYKIVHIQGHLPMFFLFIPVLKLKGKKIFWTMHDVNLRPSNRGLRSKLDLLFTYAVSQPWIIGRYADVILVHGAILRSQLAAKGVNVTKIHVIPHFDHSYLLKSAVTAAPVHNTLPKDYVLLFGKISPYKGIEVLIDAARIVKKKLPNNYKFNLLIAGEGDLSYIEKLLSKEDYDYIYMLNKWIPASELPILFRRARLVVLPYTDASQSGVISLAYTFSRPVIASDVGSIAEYIEHNETGFIFETRNSTQLANYVVELIEDRCKCIQMGIKANQKLLKEMSLEKCCQIINDLYIRS